MHEDDHDSVDAVSVDGAGMDTDNESEFATSQLQYSDDWLPRHVFSPDSRVVRGFIPPLPPPTKKERETIFFQEEPCSLSEEGHGDGSEADDMDLVQVA